MMKLILIWLCCTTVALTKIATAQPQSHCHQPSVTIANGTIVGTTSSTTLGVQKFLGIPYAQPPVGALRLQHALPISKAFGTIAATEFGHSCYGNGVQPNASEDCLTLNIWRPDGDLGDLPVLVWLYGGGLQAGYTADPVYEGSNMVRISGEIGKPVILVTVNYRLGSLGFLNGRQMAELGLLNIGMLDQRMALGWIQDNIAAFGGDATKVTLFGESAGAVSAYSHLMAYKGRNDNLFRAVILQSGGAFPLTLPNTTAFQETFDSLFSGPECSGVKYGDSLQQVECIRSLPIDTFRSRVGRSTGQSIDGVFSTTSLRFALPKGEFVKGVAVMVGAQGYFRPRRLSNATVSTLLSIYPSDPRLGCPYNTGTAILSGGDMDKKACSIFGDLVQIAPARFIASTLTSQDVHRVYHYRFNHASRTRSAQSLAAGIGTGQEQAYVFSSTVPDDIYDKALAYEMTAAWISFAHGLDPNWGAASTLPRWDVYGGDKNSMVFSGFGSLIEKDLYRDEGMRFIIDEVLPDGAL